MTVIETLKQARIAMVRKHMDLENKLDFEATLETFAHPRYELIGNGQTFDGHDQVRKYFERSRAPFPDQSNEIFSLRAMDDAVLSEFWLMGTHKGPIMGPNGQIAPTGRRFRVRMAAIFEFAPDSDKIVCERVYFDQMSIIRQLTDMD
jgi:predicted ester cyclase